VIALFSSERGPFIPSGVIPEALDTLKLFFPTVDTPEGAPKPIPPNPLFPSPKLGVDGDLRGVAEFGVSSSLSSSSPFEAPPPILASLKCEGGDLRGASGDTDTGWLVGFETTRLKGAFGVPDGDDAETTTVGVGGRSSALWLRAPWG
jgi:hypothetical protein